MIACRTIPKAQRAAAEMAGNVEVRHPDLADLTNVRTFADSVDTVDVLVNNAGVMSQTLPRTADVFEAHMGTNYLGHFALTCLLGPSLRTERRLGPLVDLAIARRRHPDAAAQVVAQVAARAETGQPRDLVDGQIAQLQ